MTRQSTWTTTARAVAACMAAMTLVPLRASAQQAAPTARVDVGAEAVSSATQHLHRLTGDKRLLAIGETEAQVIDPATLTIERRIAFDQVEWAARGDGHNVDPVLLRGKDDKQTLINPLSDAQVSLVAGEVLLLVTAVGRDGVVVTLSKDETRVIVRRVGREAPLATLDRPSGTISEKSPTVRVSDSGKLLAVAWSGTVRLVDLADGSVRAVRVTPGAAMVVHATFTSDDSVLVLITESGPFEVRNTKTLDVSGRITVPAINRRFSARSHRGGSILEVEGRRQRVIFDTKTGKHVTAERMSSGSGFLLRFVEPDLVLRASAYRMGKGSAYGLYRHERGDFRLLFREVADGVVLNALTTSSNGKCLFVFAKSGAKIVDTAANRTLATAPDVSAVTHAQFTATGDAVIATDEAGRLLRVAAPSVCHATAPAQR